MNAPWSYSGSQPTVGFQEIKERIVWLSLGANDRNPCPPPLTRKPKPCSEINKNVNGKEPLETTTPLLTHSVDWQDMSRPLYSGCKQNTASTPEANWHHGLCTLRLQRSRTDDPPHPPGLSHLEETEAPVMAAGWVNHQQAVGNGGRPAPHCPIPGNMWTEGLSTADRPQKKK